MRFFLVDSDIAVAQLLSQINHLNKPTWDLLINLLEQTQTVCHNLEAITTKSRDDEPIILLSPAAIEAFLIEAPSRKSAH